MEARKRNIIAQSIVNFFKGVVFGMVNIVPGISGATIAVVMGIYEGMISGLNTMFKGKKQFAAAVVYLLPIALGAIIGILDFATLVSYCLEHFSLPTNIFFAGLIIGTIPNLVLIIYPGLKKKKPEVVKPEEAAAGEKESRGFKAWHIIPFAVAAALVVSLTFITGSEPAAALVPWQYALLPAVGFAAAIVMMIPGVSGSFFLLLIGWYKIILDAVKIESLNPLVIALFGAGAVLGILAAAKIIDFLFKRIKTVAYLAILGLVTGCIACIFIMESTYRTGTGTWGIIIGIALGVAGIVCALLLGYKPKTKAPPPPTFFKKIPVGFLGTNCYIIGGEIGLAAVIDPGADYERIKAALDGNGLKAEAVLLTHGHFDHVGAVKEFRDGGVKVYMHEADAGLIRKFSADAYVRDGEILNIAGLNIKVIYTPGHTRGGVCYYTGGTLFSGDTLFHGDAGRTDFEGGDFGQIKESIQNKLYTLPDDTKVFPGHEEETTIGEEKSYNNCVKAE